MTSHIGTLTVDGNESQLVWATCELFAGRLDLDFNVGEVDGSLQNIPFGDAVEFASLSDRTVAILDCLAAKFERTICFELNNDFYSVTSLAVDAVNHDQKNDRLSFDARLTAIKVERGGDETRIDVNLITSAECVPFDRRHVVAHGETIPVCFANHYLPLIGLPVLPEGATRGDVVAEYGPADDAGGGPHTKFGDIPRWIRYTLTDYFLRFQMDSNRITHVTVIPKNGPFAPKAG